jgi:hypothetical protein
MNELFLDIAKLWALIIGTFITIYLFIPRVYIWLSYDDNKKNTYLKIKNTSKIGTHIQIKNIEKFKNIVEEMAKGHSNFRNGWDEHFLKYGNKINVPPDAEISLSLGFYSCELDKVKNEFKLKFKQGWFPYMHRKIYIYNLKRFEEN